MAASWKTMRNKKRPPPTAETECLLSSSPDYSYKYDQMEQVFGAYTIIGSQISLDVPSLKLSTLKKIFKRFRSGSVDSDKSATSLDEDGSRPGTLTPREVLGKRDQSTGSPHHHPSNTVWVTNASHPSPFSPPSTDAQGQPLTGSRTQGHLSDLSLQSTPLVSGSLPALPSKSDPGTQRMALSGQVPLTAQELYDSTLSALNETATSPVKSPGEKKVAKKRPSGTFEYTITEGDTLVKIGAQFDVTPSELMKINRLVSRTVFVGQTLYIPYPIGAPGETPIDKGTTDVADFRPKMDIPLATLPVVPGHAVQVTSPTDLAGAPTKSLYKTTSLSEEDEPDKECMQKFLKMPVRRVIEEGEAEDVTGSEGFTVKGTLLVTPNAIMFDPSVNDPIMIENNGQPKFSVVVYLEDIKSVALFHDISPRMFWKQPKELRGQSPRPETYRSGQGKRPKVEGQAQTEGEPVSVPSSALSGNRLTPDGASIGGDGNQQRASPDGRDMVTGRMSEELEHMTEMSRHISDLTVQPGRASEEVEHALTSSLGYTPSSPMVKQMSHSSEHEANEISQHQGPAHLFSEARDFGPHMGRSSSEIHRQTSSALGRIYDASPGDMSGHNFTERSDSTSESVNTPTQGFAPVHFTDRSPMTVTTHPKPVSGQRLMVMSQSPGTAADIMSQQNKISEDLEIGAFDMSSIGFTDSVTDKHLHHGDQDSLSDFSIINNIPTQDGKETTSISETAAVEEVPNQNEITKYKSSDAKAFGEDELSTKETSDTQTAVSTLASQIADLTLAASDDSKDNLDNDSKPKDDSPRLPFSPLRIPAQHISSFFNYTSSFFSSSSKKDDSPPAQPHSGSDGKGKYTSVPSSTPYKIQLKSEFTKADISKALGPDPKEYLPRSDSCHFEESPLYLQIRPGISKDAEVHQPRAFDHRNTSPLLNDYWFVVPREMGDKLYNFLIKWQPDAYGDEEETSPREKFFYDIRAHQGLSATMAAGDAPNGGLLGSDNYFSETEKTWEILSKEEVYRAEKEQALHIEEMLDESNFPELIGPTVIIKEEHIRAIMRSLPRNMSVGYNWELVYATHKHGYSLHNLYKRTEEIENDSSVLLFIMDTYGSVFGAYLSNTIRPNDTFYGSGATFLFTFYPSFKKFPWQGANQFFMHGTKEFFAVGAGEGVFGLWLDGDLDKGRSHECTTFHNHVLAREEDFNILQLEVWKFVDSSLL